jgi:acylphosphatase
MLVARRFVLKGRVQGVGFRFFAERMAGLEGIHGWVANRDDGAVEVFAEGEKAAVDRFAAKIRVGPPSARVDDVWTDDDVPSGQSGGFTVLS